MWYKEPNQYSKTVFEIGGITVNVYNLDQLREYMQKSQGSIPVNVLYSIHGRLQDCRMSESFGSFATKYYQEKVKDVPMIFVGFDCRNHGTRVINAHKNWGWDEHNKTNKTHAMDMFSIIDGTVEDLKMIIDYLPSYLQAEANLNPDNLKFTNIVSGISLGGHIVYRFAAKYPGSVDILNPIIGCSNLSSLMINRLLTIEPKEDPKFYSKQFDQLGLGDLSNKYPKSLHDYIKAQDLKVINNFPYEKRLFSAMGKSDPLVQNIYSLDFLHKCQTTNPKSQVFREEGKVHEVTDLMITKFIDWLVDVSS